MGPHPRDQEQSEHLVIDTAHKKPVWYKSRRWQIWLGVVIALLLATGLVGGTDKGRASLRNAHAHASGILWGDKTSFVLHESPSIDTFSAQKPHQQLKHLLIPASSPSPHLCKLLLTASTLSYPNPHLLAWQETFDKPGMMSGGSHIAKITRTLEYLEKLDASSDDDLVLMIDGYDIWFQLPMDVLVSRYYSILSETDHRLKERYGQTGWAAVQDQELHDGLSSRVVFAAGKRCAPNQVHTIACYALPASPLPADLYGLDTDTPIGHNQYYSSRQRYLNSGIIMGPVRDMRMLFERANASTTREELWLQGEVGPGDLTDSGSGGSEYFYHGSDQSIFARIWGRQEYIIEAVRRRLDPGWDVGPDSHKSSVIESTLIKDILSPQFPHEHWNEEESHFQIGSSLAHTKQLDPRTTESHELLQRYSFGITLDYFSDIGHQTANSERDATWIMHGPQQSVSEQIEQNTRRGPFDCKSDLSNGSPTPWDSKPSSLLVDILSSHHPSVASSNSPDQNVPNPWLQTPLYTHICLARVPVMIHHNGDKGARERDWNKMSWLYNVARPRLFVPKIDAHDGALPEEAASDFGGACTDKGNCVSWDQLCPKEMLNEENVFSP